MMRDVSARLFIIENTGTALLPRLGDKQLDGRRKTCKLLEGTEGVDGFPFWVYRSAQWLTFPG
jgi:hypothetical protein